MGKFKEISLMNAFLCFSVVAIHLTAEAASGLTFGTWEHTLVFIINKILCFAVPSFLFLSGLKLHNKFNGREIGIGRFYFGRFKKIVIPYVVCVLVFFFYFFSKGWVEVARLPEYIFLGTLVAHCYYIVVAVQFYLLFPFLVKIFERFPKTVTVLALVCTVVFSQFLRFQYTDRVFTTYIFWFVLGMFFSKYKIYEKLRKSNLIFVLGFVLFGVLAAVHLRFHYVQLTTGQFYRFGELVNIAYVFCAIVFLYGAFQRLGKKCGCVLKFAQVINNTSFSIYLYHIFVIFLLQYDVFPLYETSVGERLAISSAVVLGLMLIYSFSVYFVKNRFMKKS